MGYSCVSLRMVGRNAPSKLYIHKRDPYWEIYAPLSDQAEILYVDLATYTL